MQYSSICPSCKKLHEGAFPVSCECGFNLEGLTGVTLSGWQVGKLREHTDLKYGTDIKLYGKDVNCSFSTAGFDQIEDVTRFALSFGERATIPRRGGVSNVIVSYIPEIIGYGTARGMGTSAPVSGCCLISPASEQYAHAFPAFNSWISNTFPAATSNCRKCGKTVPFAEPFCLTCVGFIGDWKNLVKRR